MSRPKKKPYYNPDNLMQQLLAEVSEAYLTPAAEHADTNGHMQLNQLAEEFSMTPIKIRKLLITAGVYETATSKRGDFGNGHSKHATMLADEIIKMPEEDEGCAEMFPYEIMEELKAEYKL